ncbi:glycosyl transferase [Palaeococcus pacificus DY20341]|uniref:Glycosyl transferase n=1 Tax=Palaeococcus pacificus DY20341 TaxID=1343739 RepID=A0A075LZG2_9EURY|nr:glycosyltransferase family 4 protein [Palaeococcus pacificus]AIF69973.1 glycosyl transferase [Palaeococcus pacificus DY20341]
MKIALVSDWYYPKVGGVASHMHNLALKLRERGNEVAIVTNYWKTGKEEELEKNGIELIKVEGVISPILSINLSFGINSSEELFEYLNDFDVIHSHHAFTPLALKAAKAGRKMGKATLLTTHSISFAHESKLWKALGLSFPVFSHYLKFPHCIISVSEASKSFIEHFTDTEIKVIPNGVDDKRFHPNWDKEELKEEYDIEGDVILYVSRMSYRKGPQVLLNAFSRLKEGTLIMVGPGELLPFLKAQAKFLGIDKRVRFLGYVPSNELPKLFGMADIFVLPSVTAEAFGIVILEAMASGVPVVATNVGGIPEIVRESQSGLLVPPSNETALKDAIEALLADKELRNKLGKNGRRAVERRYSWDVVSREVEETYEYVLSKLKH